MLKVFFAIILCTSYFVKDGMLASWSWEETIHHEDVAHAHEHEDASHKDDDHRNDDCCITAHNFILKIDSYDLAPSYSEVVTSFPVPKINYLPWTLAPPLRPPIA